MSEIKWKEDAAHTQVQFKAKHMMISTVVGEVKDFEVAVTTEEYDFSTAKAVFKARVDSIETKNKQREAHLHSSDFFDKENYPEIIFESTNIQKLDDEEFTMIGNLTMRGVTKEISLNVEFGGMVSAEEGKKRAGFEIKGKVNRKDYGMEFNALTEAGGMVVSDTIKIAVNLELLEE
ncbi:MAG TPA: YceI family protein [Chitinophagaceae bacterium]|nr:YceI family protein [Chitinophagaceae bacterium]